MEELEKFHVVFMALKKLGYDFTKFSSIVPVIKDIDDSCAKVYIRNDISKKIRYIGIYDFNRKTFTD